jgi:alanyl-tRNA synthetase
LNHTGTHLLHKALKIVLGNDVQQAGSLVSYNHLRFDLTYYKKIKQSELDKVEDIINETILKNLNLNVNVKKYTDAKSEGAEALFGEKYGDNVRVVNVDGFSKELCGGTHVKNTSEIGLFKIISESSLASGVRRIEALTGEYAFSYFRDKSRLLLEIKNILMCNEEDMLSKVENITLLNKKYKKEIQSLSIKESKVIIKESIKINKIKIDNVFVYSDVLDLNIQPNVLSDLIRDNLKVKGVGLVSLKLNSENIIVCSITKDLNASINAGNIIKNLAQKINLKGGGSKYMAMLKLSNNYSFKDALKKGLDIIKEMI